MKNIILYFATIIFLAGCASSQTSRETSVFCKDDYIFALEDVAGTIPDHINHEININKASAGYPTKQMSYHMMEQFEYRSQMARKNQPLPLDPPGEKQRYVILIMSGGGQNGAFGAGVLNGWSARTEGMKRSGVDMITTISTGAMALTYTLVGNYGLAAGNQVAKADLALKKIFTETPQDELLEEKGIFSIIRTNSFANTEGMGRKLDEAIEEFMPMISGWSDDDIWAGKMAFVGMVNMDDSKFYAADLLHLARHVKTDPTARDCYKEIILASAAEPAFFPPRFITTDATDPLKGRMYVDGGLRFGVFWNENLKALKKQNLAIDVYVIVNGDLAANSFICDDSGNCFREEKTIKNKVLDIAKRSSAIATDQLYKGALDRIYWNLVSEFGLADFTMKYTYIKPEFIRRESCKRSLNSFDPVYMSCLYKIGETVGKTWAWQDFEP